MIRVLLGAALPILGFGLAAAFVGPNLFGAPGGVPMLVAQPGAATYHSASFDAAFCAEPQLLAERSEADAVPGLHIVALAFFSEANGVMVALKDVPSGAVVPDETLLLVLDASGRVLASGSAASLARQGSTGEATDDCSLAPRPAPAGSI